jgi:D-alanyl-D-alanine carboxypeptidase
MRSTANLQKPLLYLDKRELSQIKAESFIVMEYPSLQIIIGNRFKSSAEIASLTKIMTFYTIYQIVI